MELTLHLCQFLSRIGVPRGPCPQGHSLPIYRGLEGTYIMLRPKSLGLEGCRDCAVACRLFGQATQGEGQGPADALASAVLLQSGIAGNAMFANR